VQQSHFNPNRPTRVLVHGWWEDETSDISTLTSAELLNYYDFNVIFIDWSEGARTINYIGARNRVGTVGTYIASYLDFLHENGFIQFNRVGLVGFSLGAHICGLAGKEVRRGRVHSIIGLDPAGPLFSTRDPSGRLDAGDADYVEVIHTNGPTLLIVGAGIGSPIGHADFWPNGGTSQPGCLTNTCSHGRAVDFYGKTLELSFN
jgi:pancreatic triacylglycerol lipase